MREMPDNSVDSIVTDPPYELGFMGKSWDSSGVAFNIEVWQEALRVLKPGGQLIAFSGSRTYHRMAVAIEDAGFQIRDQIMWVYGSGFPKSMDISKAIDNHAGAVREVIAIEIRYNEPSGIVGVGQGERELVERKITSPFTDEAKQWKGWGTALKPAHEPMVLARKPVIGTVANNVLTYGVGGLNIDGSRVAHLSEADRASATPQGKVTSNKMAGAAPDVDDAGRVQVERPDTSLGRWPANFIHDGLNEEWARFFYCAKTSKRDRNEGLEEFEEVREHDGRAEGKVGGNNPRNRTNAAKLNHHPTVKPTSLMQYLVRLVTPQGGTVLDPFMGSGSTGKACVYEGFNFIGIDQSSEYVEIARARIDFALDNIDADI
jgi:site-specific DNA-methyltransferase (adenine-specific)